MQGSNKAVTIIGGIGTFLTTIGASGIAALPPEWKVPCILCTVIGGGVTAMAFYLSKGKDVTGGTIQQ